MENANLKIIYIINLMFYLHFVFCDDIKNEQKKITNFQHISESCSRFSSDLFQTLTFEQNQENVITSPLSTHIILSLLYQGSSGLTKDELKSTLHISNFSELQKELGYLFTSLNTIENTELEIANALYIDNDFVLQQDFLAQSRNIFQTNIEQVDFQNSDDSAMKINTWVQNKTRGKISHIINSSDIHKYTEVILMNALYFKSSWLHPFEEKITNTKKFFNIDKVETYVPTMSQTVELPHGYIKKLDANFIKMKYMDDSFEMFIILPNKVDGFYELEKQFSWEIISKAAYSTKEVELSLPKFKIETSINLKSTLHKLGLNRMFQEKANFSLMAEKPLYVDRVLQKSYLEVNEKGSEATVVTAAQMRSRRMIVDVETFIVDRPFIFIIHHKPSNIPLFIGSIKKLGKKLQKDEL